MDKHVFYNDCSVSFKQRLGSLEAQTMPQRDVL